MSDIAIKVEHVSKEYRLGMIGGTTLRADLQRFFAKLRGKEDPNSLIGSDQSRIGEKFLALDDISFEVGKGEALGIIGHNGAGKSTLLKLLSRVTAPTKGKISFNGRIASMLEVGTGFHPELTGRENVYMNGAILGMRKAEITKKFDEIVEFAEMGQFIDTPVKRYSSGMYVKLAFSVAAHLDAEIMIMDEVLAVGDMKFQQKCLQKMNEASENEGRTVLYVSHNMNTIRQLCKRCIVLEHGRIIFDGNTEDAIGIYMSNKINSQTYIDYSDFVRPPFFDRDDAKLLSVEYENKASSLFRNDEKIKLKLKLKFNKKIEKLSFRFVVECLDTTKVCAAFANNFTSGKAGDVQNINMCIDISALAPGNYQTFYVLFESSKYGTIENLDWVPGLCVTKDKTYNGNLLWKSSIWGHLELPHPVVSVSKEG